MKYYNGARTHLSLEKDAPVSRAVDRHLFREISMLDETACVGIAFHAMVFD
jgi:hypothetical protein